jgi:uncharacterized protein (DUF58 family)
MGRVAIKNLYSSPFEVSIKELIALQQQVIQSRSKLRKHHAGAALAQSKIRGRGMDFVETRNYYPGDDIRLMDWRVTARTNKPHVKVFQVERERPVLIFYDANPTMYFGTQVCLKTVVAAKLAALLSWTARAHGDRVGGFLSSLVRQQLWMPHAHNMTLIGFLKGVSEATTQYNNPNWVEWSGKKRQVQFVKGLKELLKNLKPGSLIIFISDWYYDLDNLYPYFLELRQRHDLIMYHVRDQFERSAPGEGVFPITDGKTTIPLNFYSEAITNDYSKFCEEKLQTLIPFAKKIAIPSYEVSAFSDLSHLVQQSLLRGLRG